MHLFCACTAIIVVLSGSSLADASYIIRLKNGSEYFTTRYWQEGRQLLFDMYGGVFGVQKAFVVGIERAPQDRSGPAGSRELPETARMTSSPETTLKNPSEDLQPRSKPERSLSDPIVGEFSRLLERSKQVDSLLTSEIRELLKEVVAFRNKLSKDSKLFVEYGREFNDAHEIGDVVESALRSRTQ